MRWGVWGEQGSPRAGVQRGKALLVAGAMTNFVMSEGETPERGNVRAGDFSPEKSNPLDFPERGCRCHARREVQGA